MGAMARRDTVRPGTKEAARRSSTFAGKPAGEGSGLFPPFCTGRGQNITTV